jgi:hypothetical protein
MNNTTYTAICNHIDNGNEEDSLFMLKAQAKTVIDPNYDNTRQTILGFTLLIKTIKHNMSDIALELIECYKKTNNYNYSTNEGNVLTIACYHNSEDVALKLLEFDDLNYNHISKSRKDNAMVLACKNKMKPVIMKLLEKDDVEFDPSTKGINTAMYWICENKLVYAAEKILTEKEYYDVSGMTKEHDDWFDMVDANLKAQNVEICI